MASRTPASRDVVKEEPYTLQHFPERVSVRFDDLGEMNNEQIPPRLVMQ